MHVVFHSLIKTCLFLCAGGIIFKTGLTKASQLTGIGKRMPVTLWCFTIAGLGLIGIPPLSGFASKWNLVLGSLASGTGALSWVGPSVLLVSAVLTAGYLLPITVHGFFPGEGYDLTQEKCELNVKMLAPLVFCAGMTLLLGMFPGIITGFIDTIVHSVL